MAADGRAMTYHLNRKAGTLANPLAAAGAANVWAGTSGLELVHALNVKAGRTDPSAPGWKDLQGVLNELAGTTGLGVDAAAGSIV